MNETDKIRINIDVAKAHKHYIDDLIKESGVNTLASLFRKSLHLFELVTKHQKSGGKVVFEHANGERETMKFL